jgi:hypothetical protein
LIAESLDGVRVVVTRQKEGSVSNLVNAGRPAIPEPPGVGGVKLPAATTFEEVIVAFGTLREERLSQLAAASGDAVSVNIARPVKNVRTFLAATSPP